MQTFVESKIKFNWHITIFIFKSVCEMAKNNFFLRNDEFFCYLRRNKFADDEVTNTQSI